MDTILMNNIQNCCETSVKGNFYVPLLPALLSPSVIDNIKTEVMNAYKEFVNQLCENLKLSLYDIKAEPSNRNFSENKYIDDVFMLISPASDLTEQWVHIGTISIDVYASTLTEINYTITFTPDKDYGCGKE